MGKSIGKIIVLLILAAGIGVGVFFGCRAAYEDGHKNGYEAGKAENSEMINVLADAVIAKNEVLKILESIKAPDTVTNNNVDNYLKGLGEIEAKMREKNEAEIADLLVAYKESWKDFKVAYASKDNELIKGEFAKIKTAHETFTKKTEEILNARIESAYRK